MGDIPYRDANYFSYYYGHTGTITQLDFDVNKLRGSLSVNNSTITEAAGYNSGVRYAQMNTSFFLPGENTIVLRYKNPLTDKQMLDMRNYLYQQVGKGYLFPNTKSNESKFYCSQLVWQAYLKYVNIDLDSNGGAMVMPNDILASNLLKQVYVYNDRP